MNEKINKLVGYINRILSNDYLALKIYQYWAIGVFILFGVFGVFSVSKVIYQKVPLILEMQKVNSDLSKKAEDLAEIEKTLLSVNDNLIFLRNYLPDNFDIQNYMVDFVIATSQSGFIVDKFVPIEEVNNVISISVHLSGSGDLLSLVRGLEDMDRITEIVSIDYTKDSNDDRIKMVVNTFSMKKQ